MKIIPNLLKKTGRLLGAALLLATAAPQAGAAPAGDWKLHPTFDSNILRVIDTPEKVYMLARPQDYNTAYAPYSTPYANLFVYDKESEEMLSYSKRNYLSDNIVSYVDYNPEKKFLLVVYDTADIDLIYDSGEVRNIPGLKSATLPGSKAVNFASFDNENGRVYLATDFGYLVLNSDKAEIAESRVFNRKINAVARVGDFLVLCDESAAYQTAADTRYPLLSDFKLIRGIEYPRQLLPLDNNRMAYLSSQNNTWYITTLDDAGAASEPETMTRNSFSGVSANRDGYILTSGGLCILLGKDGRYSFVYLDTPDKSKCSGSWDGREFWIGGNREGLYSRRLADDGSWTTTRQAVTPNAPTAFQCSEMVNTRNYGTLIVNHGINNIFSGSAMQYPNLLCALDNGEWKRYSQAWNNPTMLRLNPDPGSIAVDPDDERYVYTGSFFRGILRQNLEDPEDLVQMASPATRFNGVDFFEAFPTCPNFTTYGLITSLSFDNDGNLWCVYPHIYNHATDEIGKLRVLSAADRRAGRFGNWTGISLPGATSDTPMRALPLRATRNRNIVVLHTGAYGGDMILLNHNGTPDNTSDDTVVHMTTIYDQDGVTVDKIYANDLWEDPETGMVWVLTPTGIFYFDPVAAFSAPSRVNRIKVARNDGTNLADYLLDGVFCTRLATDPQGHKWFATAGAGIIVTSSDGREIIAQYTSDNSYLPDNNVYGITYVPASGSFLISTQKGIAEYFPPGSASGEDLDSVKIYPNPVRPDYYGWITIEGLTDNAIVKIVDASGNLVRELGLAAGGVVQWDGANLEHKRVRSGVYFVLSSSGPGDQNLANVGKILVVN